MLLMCASACNGERAGKSEANTQKVFGAREACEEIMKSFGSPCSTTAIKHVGHGLCMLEEGGEQSPDLVYLSSKPCILKSSDDLLFLDTADTLKQGYGGVSSAVRQVRELRSTAGLKVLRPTEPSKSEAASIDMLNKALADRQKLKTVTVWVSKGGTFGVRQLQILTTIQINGVDVNYLIKGSMENDRADLSSVEFVLR